MVTGVSFSPLSQPTTQGTGAPASPTNAVQDAIRLLSLKLPTLGPTAPSGVLGLPTALGPSLGGALAQQNVGRSKVMPVPQVNAGMTPDVLTKLLQALGLPSLGGAPAPAAVKFHGPPNAIGALGGPPPASMADLLSNITGPGTSDFPGAQQLQPGSGSPLTQPGIQDFPGAGRLQPMGNWVGPTAAAGNPFRAGSPDYQQPY